MKSKIEEYLNLYNEFESACEVKNRFVADMANYRDKIDKKSYSIVEQKVAIDQSKKIISDSKDGIEEIKNRFISDCENRIGQIRERQKQDVIRDMDEYINEAIQEKKTNVYTQVNYEIERVSPADRSVIRSVKKVLSGKDEEQSLIKAVPDYGQHVCAVKKKNAIEFIIVNILNTVFSLVFRFSFLIVLPKVLRPVVGVLFWSVFFGILQLWIKNIKLILVIVFASNIMIYYLEKYIAKRFVTENVMVYLSVVDSRTLCNTMCDYRMSAYMNETVGKWREEIEYIRENGFNENTGNNTLCELSQDYWHKTYNVYEQAIAEEKNDMAKRCNEQIAKNEQFIAAYENRIAQCEECIVRYEDEITKCEEQMRAANRRKAKVKERMDEIISKLKEKEEKMEEMVSDSDYNKAVLSPYVSTGFLSDIGGVRKISYYKHDYKPMLFCHNKESDQFREDVAEFIESFMYGFFRENYYKYIKMWLVDFEGLHFPDSRTKGLITVIDTQQELKDLFDHIKKTRQDVYKLDYGDGQICKINPKKLEQYENPIPYNIVYFIGNFLNSIDEDIVKLFIDGEHFGFLPIIFMNDLLVQDALEESDSLKGFSRVVAKIQQNGQIYKADHISLKTKHCLKSSM